MFPVSVIAPAKLNLFLHIVGKRPDGYHLLESLVVFTEFGDRLDFKPADKLSLEIAGEFAGNLQADCGNNHIIKAAKLLQPYAKGQGASVILHKHIPTGAGLGGGSSDAAATLKALCKLWDIKPSKQDLMAIALRIGSDVPVCYEGVPSIMSGIGEQVTPVDIDEAPYILLVNSREPLLTAAVYKQFSSEYTTSGAFQCSGSLYERVKATHNMLEKPAINLMPQVKDIISAIGDTHSCKLARMSGSGATCFGLYDNEYDAKQAMEVMKIQFPQAWFMVTRMKHGKTQ